MSEYIVDFEAHNAKAAIALCDGVHELIVRCRDCINYSGEDDEIYPKWCMENNTWEIESDGFCKWGERRNQQMK